MWLWELYSFLRAAATKYNKRGGFKQQKFILSQLFRLKIWNQGVSSTMFILPALEENPSWPLSSYWWLLAIWAFLGLSTPLQPHGICPVCYHIVFPLGDSVHISSYKDTNHWVWTHLIQYDLTLIHYICTDLVTK